MSRTYKHDRLDEDGREMPDPVPMAPPVGYHRQPSLAERIREMVRSEKLAQDLAARGVETFEEADDFDIPDDPVDPSTPYEQHFDPTPVSELRKRGVEAAQAEARRRAQPVEEELEGEPAASVPPAREKPVGEAPKPRRRADIED